jgi:hypothetical protein
VFLGGIKYLDPEDAGQYFSNERVRARARARAPARSRCARPRPDPFLLPLAQLGAFYVVIGMWYVLFAILGLLAEIRVACLKRTVLFHFGFLHGFVGRGCAYMLLGCIYAAIPIAVSQGYTTIAPGVVLSIAGALEAILGCFVVRSSKAEAQAMAAAVAASVANENVVPGYRAAGANAHVAQSPAGFTGAERATTKLVPAAQVVVKGNPFNAAKAHAPAPPPGVDAGAPPDEEG